MPKQTFSDVVIAEIKAEMARQDVTQRELATRVGWATNSAVSRRLLGKTPISVRDIEQIAEALGVTVHALGWPFEPEPHGQPRRSPRRAHLVPAGEPAQSLWDVEIDGREDGNDGDE